MPITIESDLSRRRGRKRPGDWHSVETLTQSTATTPQSLNLTVDLSYLGMGTATGFGVNGYRVTDGFGGLRHFMVATASGEAKVFVDTGTATGAWVLDAVDDFLALYWLGGKWRLMASSGATLATAT